MTSSLLTGQSQSSGRQKGELGNSPAEQRPQPSSLQGGLAAPGNKGAQEQQGKPICIPEPCLHGGASVQGPFPSPASSVTCIFGLRTCLQSLPSRCLQSLPSTCLQSLPSRCLQSFHTRCLQSLPSPCLQSLHSRCLQSFHSRCLQSLPSRCLLSLQSPTPSCPLLPLQEQGNGSKRQARHQIRTPAEQLHSPAPLKHATPQQARGLAPEP